MSDLPRKLKKRYRKHTEWKRFMPRAQIERLQRKGWIYSPSRETLIAVYAMMDASLRYTGP